MLMRTTLRARSRWSFPWSVPPGQGANLLVYSQDFENAAWSKSSASITTNSILAPDGTPSADLLIENVELAPHYINQAVTLAPSSTYTLSVYVKSAVRTLVNIQFIDGAEGASCEFDLATGTNTSNAVIGGAYAVGAPSITALANSWFRVTSTVTTNASAVQNIRIGTPSALGDGFVGIYLWGSQLEVGSSATDYQRTEG